MVRQLVLRTVCVHVGYQLKLHFMKLITILVHTLSC